MSDIARGAGVKQNFLINDEGFSLMTNQHQTLFTVFMSRQLRNNTSIIQIIIQIHQTQCVYEYLISRYALEWIWGGNLGKIKVENLV